MKTMRAGLLAGGLLLALALKAAPPEWLADAAARPPTPVTANVPAQVLYEETILEGDDHGRITETHRLAVRVLNKKGAAYATAAVDYVEKADKVGWTDAWLLRQGKGPGEYSRGEWIDSAKTDLTMLYTDFRRRAIIAADAEPGDVFGAETVVVRRSSLGLFDWQQDADLPVRLWRLECRVPRGWSPRAAWFNCVPPQTGANARQTVWRWELRDLPKREEEPWSPPGHTPRVAVTLQAPAGTTVEEVPDCSSWKSVARWLAKLQAPQCDENPELVRTARALTGPARTPGEAIMALAHFVQERHYVAINRNTGIGFGYRPRRATETLAAGYGDCKDKSNLLQALLGAAGFKAYLVGVFAGDADGVEPAWPAPVQFNHAIIAIAVPDSVQNEACLAVPGFGRLMFFDPTDRWIPPGELPWLLQGSRGLICDPATESLVTLPTTDETRIFRAESHTDLKLDEKQRLTGKTRLRLQGELAAFMRATTFQETPAEQRDKWGNLMDRALRGVTVTDMAMTEQPHGTETTLSFAAPSIGQQVHGEMWLLNLDILGRDAVPTFPEKPRTQPVLVEPVSTEDEVTINVPAGYHIEEMPARREVTGDFGRYRGEYFAEGGAIRYQRSLVLKAALLPPEKAGLFRKFLVEVARAERSSVILRLDK